MENQLPSLVSYHWDYGKTRTRRLLCKNSNLMWVIPLAKQDSKREPHTLLPYFIPWVILFPVSSSTDPSDGWPMACFKQLNPAAWARGTIMTAPTVKSDTAVFFCWILNATRSIKRPKSLQRAPTTWIWTLVCNIQLWEVPNYSGTLKTRTLLHDCLATAFQTKFEIVRRRKSCVPLKYSTLVQTGNSVKISTKHTQNPRAAHYIGTTLKTAVKHSRTSWNVQVLVDWFLPYH